MNTEIQDGSRKTLKEIFRKGRTPTQEEFHLFIDSVLNLHDDPLFGMEKGGVKIFPDTSDGTLMEFQQTRDDRENNWALRIQSDGEAQSGISLGYMPEGDASRRRPDLLVLREQGNVGINTPDPRFALEVAGAIGMQSRIGTYHAQVCHADGGWHTIMDISNSPNALGYYAFEVLAYIIPPRKKLGLYGITHAICVGAQPQGNGGFWEGLGFHNRKGIQQTRSYFEKRRRRLDLRWGGTLKEPLLQLRSNGRLTDCKIHCRVTNLMPNTPVIPES